MTVAEIEHDAAPTTLAALRARVSFVVVGWAAAFVIVTAVLWAFGSKLQELPLPVRSLVISGVMTLCMTELVVPLMRRFLGTGSAPSGGKR